MMGYYKDSEKTSEVMTGDYFHTGDIGKIDSDGFLRITDCKKEMFKTSGGKYVAPALIEGQMKQSLFIEQMMVIEKDKKMPAALIQPNFEYIAEWIKDNNIDCPSDDLKSICNEQLRAEIQADIDTHNENFSQWSKSRSSN